MDDKGKDSFLTTLPPWKLHQIKASQEREKWHSIYITYLAAGNLNGTYDTLSYDILTYIHKYWLQIHSSSFGLFPSCNIYKTLKHYISEARSASDFRQEARNLLDPLDQAIPSLGTTATLTGGTPRLRIA